MSAMSPLIMCTHCFCVDGMDSKQYSCYKTCRLWSEQLACPATNKATAESKRMLCHNTVTKPCSVP